MDCISLCFICDRNYLMPTVVALTSLISNKKDNIIYEVFIISIGLDISQIRELEKMKNDTLLINVIIPNNYNIYDNMKKDDFPVTPAALFKFDLTEILPPTLKKVLYLDGDIIILKDLKELFDTDIETYYAAVIKDLRGTTLKGDFRKRLNINHSSYFNSGVMLLNLDRLRQDDIRNKLLDYRINGTNYYMDQDAFNVVFQENVKYISFYNNLQMTCWRHVNAIDLSVYYGLVTFEDKRDYFKSAIIIHFTADKPWKFYDYHCSNIWMYYYLKSPFGNKYIDRKSIIEKVEKNEKIEKYFQESYGNIHDWYMGPYIYIAPEISVIVPVYNAEMFLNFALNSLRRQSFVNFEVICVDDGSKDNTSLILTQYANEDKRIKVCPLNMNTGAGAARNKAISLAIGRYIVFLDADDALSDDALEKFILRGRETDADLIVSKTVFARNNHILSASLVIEYLDGKTFFKKEDITKYIFNFTHGGPGGKCVKTSIIRENNILFPVNMKRSEDIIFFVHILLKSYTIAVIDSPLYKISIIENMDSLEHNICKHPFTFIDVIKEMKNLLLQEGLFEKYKQSYLNANIDRAWYNIKSISSKESVIYAKEVINPFEKYIIDELELFNHEKGFFFCNSYDKLREFISRSIYELIYEKLRNEINKQDIIFQSIKYIGDFNKFPNFKYIVGRIDLKNVGNNNNIDFINISDLTCYCDSPQHMTDDRGVGKILQSYIGELNIKFRCINDGVLYIYLKGVNNENGDQIYIDFYEFTLNSMVIFSQKSTIVSSDKPYIYKIKCENEQVFDLYVSWRPAGSSLSPKI